MQKQKKDHHFIKKPFYKGGNDAFRKFVRKELKYPELALKKKVEGIVVLKIDINYKGTVTGSKIVSGLAHGCDKEAKRIVSLLTYEVPKGRRNVKIRFHKTVRIQFSLPRKKMKKFQYELTKSKGSIEENVEKTQKKGNSYYYEIQL